MIPRAQGGDQAVIRFPRVSGDDPSSDTLGHVTLKFSPRERG